MSEKPVDLSGIKISFNPNPKVETITEDAGRLWSPGRCSTAVIVRTAHDGSPFALAAHALILEAMREALDKLATKFPGDVVSTIEIPIKPASEGPASENKE